MKTQISVTPLKKAWLSIPRCLALLGCAFSTILVSAAPLTITVMGVAADGTTTPVATNYRWTVEEDATKLSVPGQAATAANYSFSFHTSYMPVIAAGREGTVKSGSTADPDVARLYGQAKPEVCPSPSAICIDATKRYYVSIAADGYQMGGAPVVFNNGGASATVYVNRYDLPTAQLSVVAFEDNNPINGAPDLPQESGLAGFTVQLLEAGGTYGQSGGAVTQDAFGNPLGTTYNADASVKVRGNGIVLTGPDGTATIKNLFPAKYTVIIVPPVGSDWHQTTTIEGGYGSDAWVKNNEPSFFQEFGPPGHHVFIGFTKSGCIQGTSAGRCVGLTGTTARAITGRVVNTHNSRPPVYTFYGAAPVNECWVGLNEINGGRALYATPCKKDSTFTIPNVPDGTYELVMWDTPLDMIIGTTTVKVAGGNLALGDLPVTSWFARYQGRVFQDIDGTGLPFFAQPFNRPYIEVDPVTGIEKEVTKAYAAGDLKPAFGEGIASNIRFRDGSIYQSTTTKQDGTFAFTELFPFFNWMIAEIDYARFKATGATVVVDEGGKVVPADNKAKLWNAQPGLFGGSDPALAYDPWTRLNPQLQPDGNYYRNENCEPSGQCATLLEGMQTFLGQTNHIEWGKQPYAFDQNGGIAGIVHYAITRAEDDPRYATAENWEPGIPRVQVNLFLDCDGDGKPDQPSNDGTGSCSSLSGVGYQLDQPDVDNYPFCWRDPDFVRDHANLCPNGQVKGPEDIKRSRTGGAAFSYGDVFKWGAPGLLPADQPVTGLTKTDSWDDSVPNGCPATTPYSVPSTGETLDCYDGLRNFNQVRPAVFDGGYAFGRVAGQPEMPTFIGVEGKGTYIVEAMAPPGYLHQGNGDKNVVFGDSLKASPAALPFECVGMTLDVPAKLTLFANSPDADNPNYLAGQRTWRKCDMKAVPMLPGTNPAPDFHMFTEAPVAGHGVGFILDDTATEFNQYAPTFGEKYSPPHLPVSIQDWTGRELSRAYSDQYGSYNFLVPSSFTINPPYPSGVMPSMIVACMNHPGPIVDPSDSTKRIIDPHFNRNYTQFCYTLQYLPGKTTYLDTPVLPVSAFASVDKNPLDCECADGTPAIYSATNGDNGPWVPAGGGVALTIVSQAKMNVVNPAFDPSITDAADPRSKKNIQRDYGFGTVAGSVTLDGTPLTSGVTWNGDGLITVTLASTVPAGAHQLMIRRGDNGKESVVGLTVHVGGNAPKKVNLAGSGGAFKTIQAAIDSSTTVAGDLITIAPGSYPEYVVLDKRIRLQGWGAGSVTINASKPSSGGLAAWRSLIDKKIDPHCGTATGPALVTTCPAGTPIDPDTGAPIVVPGAARTFDPLPGQTIGFNASNNEPILFGAEEAPGVLVLGKSNGSTTSLNCASTTGELRVDGLTVTGSDAGGGILANGYACNLQVANNRVVANYGTYGGGIRIGHTTLVNDAVVNGAEVINFTDAVNRNPNIHHNWIAQNGATEAGGGGGLTLGTGSNNYNVSSNYICGNFSMADGGGMSHLGFSPGTNRIAANTFVFNQTFNQSADPSGGALSIGGQLPVGAGAPTGTGGVNLDANLIEGNQAGAGAGGGVTISRTQADAINVTNNMIVNNVAAYSGGGVALFGNASTGVRLVNNTIASNVSTATNRQSFGPTGSAAPSLPQIAGISVIDGNNPSLVNNIIWANRSYIYLIDGLSSGLFNPGTTSVATPAPNAQYRDLGRVANGADLTPVNSVLTVGGVNDHLAASATNVFEADNSTALFVKRNTFDSIIDRNQPVVLADATVALQSALTFDETGNFINVIFSPLTRWETAAGPTFGALRADYHITTASAAKDKGQAPTATNGVPARDFDGDTRPGGTLYDIGADELVPPRADLSITKTDGVASVNRGAAVRYTITVANAGPNPASGAGVADTMPAALTGVTWSCAASAGSSCASASGSGSIATTVSLATGGTATFTVDATVSNTATGNLVNSATVTAPATVSDPNPANNTATDTDTIVVPLPAIGLLDNFDRANATSLGANWQQVNVFGAIGVRVNGNQAQCQGSACLIGAYATWNRTAAPGPAFGTSQGAAIQIGVGGTTMVGDTLVLKASGTYNTLLGFYPNRVQVRVNSSTQIVVETWANTTTYTNAGTLTTTALVANDVLTAKVDAAGLASVWKTSGTTTTFLGSVQLPTTGANAFTTGTGRVGFYLPPNARIDNFGGSAVP
jgi:large repetitive protein